MYSYNPNQQRVFEFVNQIPSQAKDIPTRPSIPHLRVRKLRARLMTEELFELITDGLGLRMYLSSAEGLKEVLFEDVFFEEDGEKVPLLEMIADGLADCEVVNMGTAVVCGLNTQPIFDEVMNNNMLKLTTGTIDEHGKLIKAKDHPKPDIASEVEKQRRVVGG
jgi:predicted HAD superfamily Cof-like phosphohydrolase